MTNYNRIIKILIVEDNLLFALELEMLIKEIGYSVAGRVDNSNEALEIINQCPPDLILMDIEIKGNLNGIEIAKLISPSKIPVLFITSLGTPDIYEQVKVINNLGFLVKPIDKYSLITTINLAIKTMNRSSSSDSIEDVVISEEALFIKKRGQFHKIPFSEIEIITANGDYTTIHTQSGDFISDQRIGQLEKLLSKNGFIRVHRSHIVNIRYIEVFDRENNELLLGKKQIAVSRRQRKRVIEAISLYKN